MNMARTRQRLTSVSTSSPKWLASSRVQAKKDGIGLPRFLDRRKWTNGEWRRNKRAWDKVREELRKNVVRKSDAEIFENLRARKQARAEKQELRDQRRFRRLERKAEKARKEREAEEISERVYASITERVCTVGRISKVTQLDTRVVRRGLRILLRQGKVTKSSARRYVKRVRQHLTDETPKPRRRRRRKK